MPRAIVPDNLKSAVIRFQKDDVPVLNESFRDLTEHYRVTVLPDRPRKPRDKSLMSECDLLKTCLRYLFVLWFWDEFVHLEGTFCAGNLIDFHTLVIG